MKNFQRILTVAALLCIISVPSFAGNGILLADRATTVDSNGILLADRATTIDSNGILLADGHEIVSDPSDTSLFDYLYQAIAGILLAD